MHTKPLSPIRFCKEFNLGRGSVIKSYEIKRIGVGSVFKFYFLLGIVFWLLGCIILLITGTSLRTLGLELGAFDADGGFLQTGAAILGVLLASLAYGLMAGIIGAIGAVIYNGFAAVVGGIVVKLNDRD